jgi:inorganic pyrophosphatase
MTTNISLQKKCRVKKHIADNMVQSTDKRVKEVLVHIEVSSGSREKYEFDDENNRMILDRILPSGMVYPYNYGCVASTHGLGQSSYRRLS